jgi:DHA1 family tetracycline resistance protein-like MFS transporter
MMAVLATILLDVMALGIVIPVLPKLVEEFAGDTARAATIFGLFGIAWALMQFVFQPILGALSDAYGRRRIILLSNVGLGLDYILMALAPNLVWLFVGRIISGIAAASFSTATAYIADVTPPARRAANFGIMGAAFGLGFILGPAIGGLLGHTDPRLPFWVAAALSLANAFYVTLVLPESLQPEQRTPIAALRIRPLAPLAIFARHARLKGLALILFLYHLAHGVYPAIFVLHAGFVFDWSARDVGLSLAGYGACSAIVQAGLIRPAIARLGETRTMLAGLTFGVIGFAVAGLAPNGTIFLMGIPVMSLWGLTTPAVQAMMTRVVGPSEQGRLQGANGSLMALASLIAPVLFTQTFALAIAGGLGVSLPGAPYLLAAFLLAVAVPVAIAANRHLTYQAVPKP